MNSSGVITKDDVPLNKEESTTKAKARKQSPRKKEWTVHTPMKHKDEPTLNAKHLKEGSG